MTISSPLTNQRKCRCIDCAAVLAPGKGNAVAISQYVCDACRAIRKAHQDAWRYRGDILERVNNPSDRWLVNGMLTRLLLNSGLKAPQIFQAVCDRVSWMDEATYASVQEVALQEARMVGMTVQVM